MMSRIPDEETLKEEELHHANLRRKWAAKESQDTDEKKKWRVKSHDLEWWLRSFDESYDDVATWDARGEEE